ncbi:MAG: P-loop NTPase [Spirochaetales bacterium]|nr:P-loop NTPase [Spirochaetales bacterium]
MGLDLLESIKEKSLAVASGKGGVGKTMTSTNLAIYLAQKGHRVGLIDADPLSDITTLLDVKEKENRLPPLENMEKLDDGVIRIIHNLDLIFPQSKSGPEDVSRLLGRLYDEFAPEVDGRYDYLLFDMPAGVQDQENMAYLDRMNRILMVTNPEPTAHVSAGGYMKKAGDLKNRRDFLLWHNKYVETVEADFNPTDVVGNYNRNVLEEDRLDQVEIIDVARIAPDPTLDLLRSDPSIRLNILRNIIDNLQVMLELSLPIPPVRSKVGAKGYRIIRYYIKKHPFLGDFEVYLKDLEAYLFSLIGREAKGPFFKGEQREEVLRYLKKLNETPLRQEMVSAYRMIKGRLHELENSERLFTSGSQNSLGDAFHYVDRVLARFLSLCAREIHRIPLLKNMGSMLLFNFTLLKLFQSETVHKLVMDFIPLRTDGNNRQVRDRNRQIINLVRNDSVYKRKYLELVKMLRPIMEKQLGQIVAAFQLRPLLFMESHGKVNRSAYIKLFSNFLHETIYSGLGVTVGFKYRPVSLSFRKGADLIIHHMENRGGP